MNKISKWMIAGLVMLSTVVQGAIVQNFETAWTSPGNTAAVLDTFAVNRFNTSLGTLTSVTVTLTLETWGGSFFVQNTTSPSAEVSGTIYQGVSGFLVGNVPDGSLNPVFSGQNAAFVLPNTGDAFYLNGPTYNTRTIVSHSESALPGDLANYEGTGTFNVRLYGSQGSDYTSNGSVTFGGTSAFLVGKLTVTYEYVPEPTSAALLALGCAVIGLRRRVRATVKA